MNRKLIIAYACGLVVSMIVGSILGQYFCEKNVGITEPLIDEDDNADSLNSAINAYEKWLVDSVLLLDQQIENQSTASKHRLHCERELKRYQFLSVAFEKCFIPSAGSGGANVQYLYKLSKSQEYALARWIELDTLGKNDEKSDIVRQINTNSDSLDRSVVLFKLMLGRHDLDLIEDAVLVKQQR